MVGLLKGSEIARFALPAPDSVTSRPTAAAAENYSSQPSGDAAHSPQPHQQDPPAAKQQFHSSSGSPAGSHIPQEISRKLEASSISLPPPPNAGEDAAEPPALWNQKQVDTSQRKVEQDRHAADASLPLPGNAAGAVERTRQHDNDGAAVNTGTSADSIGPAANESSSQPISNGLQQNESTAHQPTADMQGALKPASPAGSRTGLRSQGASAGQHAKISPPMADMQDQMGPNQPTVGLQQDTTSCLDTPVGSSSEPPLSASTSAAGPDQQASHQETAAASSSFPLPAIPGSGPEASAGAAADIPPLGTADLDQHAKEATAAQQHASSSTDQTVRPARAAADRDRFLQTDQGSTASAAGDEVQGVQFSSKEPPHAASPTSSTRDQLAEAIPAGASHAEQASPSAPQASPSGSAASAVGQSQPGSTSIQVRKSALMNASADGRSELSAPDDALRGASRQTQRGGAGMATTAASPLPPEPAVEAALPDQQGQQQSRSVAEIRQAFSGGQAMATQPQVSQLNTSGGTAEAAADDLHRLRNPFGSRTSSAAMQPPAAQMQAENSETSLQQQQQQQQKSGAQAPAAGELRPALNSATADAAQRDGSADPAASAEPGKAAEPSPCRNDATAAAAAAPSRSASSRPQDATAASDAAAEHLRRLRDPFRRMQHANAGPSIPPAAQSQPQIGTSESRVPASGLQSREASTAQNSVNLAPTAARSPESGDASSAPAPVSAQAGASRPGSASGNRLSPSGASRGPIAGPLKPLMGAESGPSSGPVGPASFASTPKSLQPRKSAPSKASPAPSGHLHRSLTDFNPLG